MSDESLVVYGGRLLTLYEANGANVNPAPVAHLFHAAPLEPAGTLPFPNVEYRVTDATAPDDEGRFWAINYLWPGDVEKLRPAPDPIAAEHGTGATHREETTVERLVEFRITPEGIVRTETPPIWLQLETKVSRNWEGVVRLDDRGFLLVTDTFPETLLAFVPLP
jgi:hypothetical protein